MKPGFVYWNIYGIYILFNYFGIDYNFGICL